MTFGGALVVLDDNFFYDPDQLGGALVAVNFVVVPLMVYLGRGKMLEQMAAQERASKLQTQLLEGESGA